jgi:hypothetical protein
MNNGINQVSPTRASELGIDFALLTDKQDIDWLLPHIEQHERYGSYFVKCENGEVLECYGCRNAVPTNSDVVDFLLPS